jgi:membrane fusion protein (multidrug efflux system)
MEVSVDVADDRGKALADAPRAQPVAQTAVFDVLAAAADAEVARVIRANLGRAPQPVRPGAKAR